jgi:hypothetical protein
MRGEPVFSRRRRLAEPADRAAAGPVPMKEVACPNSKAALPRTCLQLLVQNEGQS